ncbi:hypothetical protein [Paenibacillus sp. FSL H8-0034]|uniref:hypothetical protein n=1 Tax=Paenibacillus sp. FSL H8-0034 TaxID=2954671 RepID=UPI0030F80893
MIPRTIKLTLDLNLIELAARRDTQAIEASGYKTNGEWPGPDFFEAAQKLLNWALVQDVVKCITARSETDNISSKNVLVKLGFQIDHSGAELLYWKYQKKM